MLVESPDGRRALLGKYKRMQGPMYTALAGFIDQVGGMGWWAVYVFHASFAAYATHLQHLLLLCEAPCDRQRVGVGQHMLVDAIGNESRGITLHAGAEVAPCNQEGAWHHCLAAAGLHCKHQLVCC